MKNLRVSVLLLGAECLWVGAASAQVLFTTQQDFGHLASQNGTNITVTTGPAGDSDGSTTNGLGSTAPGVPGAAGTAGALTLVQNVTGFNQANLGDEATNAGFLAALKANNKLTFDYTLPSAITFGATDGNYFQIIPVFNWTGGYQQLHNDPFFSTANMTAGKHTVTYDYSAFQGGLPTSPPSYFQLFLVLNSGGVMADLTTPEVGTVYIDNIRLVPEPASLLLMGLAVPALVFVVRSRRAA
jgi:PEP-CTERM motif